MLKVIRSAARDAVLPPDWHHLQIVMFPKPVRPPEDYSRYRPVFLLNLEVKIMAKALANQVVCIIPDLINLDQAGFIPGRATHHNIHRLYNGMGLADRLGGPAVGLLADIGKVCDSVS
ncbi:hypothetical protein NDU88_003664 [Pleurodeles waltl]|uniref:Reverse transcriptase domain-containing protein n=1 Tax=Pleurodeles waltl TaxID=8319 RepID=A0AAV7UZ21_PLEWA|nr:hypothetical protein NDU88_003664 [Pleurodeles waltl]